MKMIVCVSENYGIGYKNKLLFSIPEDMKLFRSETLGKTVIMGRKTLESFPGGKPLPNRCNIVISSDRNFFKEGAKTVCSREEALNAVKEYKNEDVYVIGGSSIYNMFKSDCNEAVVTKVKAIRKADSFFFDIDSDKEWKKVSESEIKEYKGLEFTFNRYISD